ncbi:hypothetical protein BTM25_34900 [Actinomadura rubteroloni]|uniref:DUF3107 domain-containing protein n=1 Tax=Actinomadura rubteroloni TaxID=1926885 RepID=A0A2P4UIG3_9ACTN|nr:DUF3107 domain-containing protein [Actinomadura rubteroloni]POM24852.1 hypothetical protein BTM25_34900 [Actinomadura rubteroloni]
MQVRIGVQYVARELVVDTPQSAAEVERALAEALAEENGVLVLADRKGGKIVVPARRLGYLEFGEDEDRRVGFGGTI